MVECLRVARYRGKALVDSSRDVVGDPRRVVGLLADVERVVIWFSKGLKFPGVQVHGDIQLLLNKRSEMVSKCRHENKFRLANFTPIK